MVEIISVRFRSEGKQYYFDPNGLVCKPGDGVIVETTNGLEYAQCIRGNFILAEAELTAPLRPAVRAATPEDEEKVARNREKEKYAYQVCQEKILEHRLEMKLVNVEYSLEGNKILFFFTSEGRVDFRGLVKSLAAVFHTRIELRQIGIRDEAKMLGGLGICGRPFCCASFLREFQPVSIKMAKTQNLSLNPTKISGTCGRLMCCLKYEQGAYEDLVKDAPRADSFVETPDGVGTIISVNTLREKVRVRLDDAPEMLKIYHNSEIRVVRSGKGKRPEDYVPPSKEDLAKLRRVTESAEDKARREQQALTAALNQFMTETEDPAVTRIRTKSGSKGKGDKPAAPVEKAEGHKPRHRHRSGGKGEADKSFKVAEPVREGERQRRGKPVQNPGEKPPVPPPAGEGKPEKKSGYWHRRNHKNKKPPSQ